MDWYKQQPEADEPAPHTFGVIRAERAAEYAPYHFGAPPAEQPAVEVEDGAQQPASEADEVRPPTFSQDEVDQAYQRGMEQAKAELAAPLEQRLEEQQRRHAEAMADMAEQLAQWQATHRHRAQQLVVEIAGLFTKHLLNRLLDEHPEHMTELAGQALERAVDQEHLRLHVRPEVAAALQDRLTELRRRHPDHAPVELVPDETLLMGDCRLMVDGGAIVGDLDERIAQLMQASGEFAAMAGWFEDDIKLGDPAAAMRHRAAGEVVEAGRAEVDHEEE